jgi:uncharacterized protein YjiS (DUF1127 family)
MRPAPGPNEERTIAMHIPAYIHLPTDAPVSRPAAPSPLLRAWRAVRAWWDHQRTLAALEELDEATLRDIGVSRDDLRARFEADRHGARGHWSRY